MTQATQSSSLKQPPVEAETSQADWQLFANPLIGELPEAGPVGQAAEEDASTIIRDYYLYTTLYADGHAETRRVFIDRQPNAYEGLSDETYRDRAQAIVDRMRGKLAALFGGEEDKSPLPKLKQRVALWAGQLAVNRPKLSFPEVPKLPANWRQSYDKAKATVLAGSYNYLYDQENGRQRRLGLVSVIGGLAVAGLVEPSIAAHSGATHHLARQLAERQPAPVNSHHLLATAPKSTNGFESQQPAVVSHVHHVAAAAKPAPKPVVLTIRYAGDNLEKEAARYLHQHNYAVNDHSVNQLTEAVLHAQHMSWAQAHFVHVGQHLRALHDVLKPLTKLKKAKSR